MKKKNGFNFRSMAFRYEEIYRDLFVYAYAITGNDRTAETALVSSMVLPISEHEDFEKAAFENLKRCAIETASNNAFDENFTCFDADFESMDSLNEWISEIADDEKRIILLRYGVELANREIAVALGSTYAKIRETVERLKAEGARHVKHGQKIVPALRKLSRKELEKTDASPDFNTLLRACENLLRTETEKSRKRKPMKRLVSWAFAAVAMIFLLSMIWISTVLISYFREAWREETGAKTETVCILEDENACI